MNDTMHNPITEDDIANYLANTPDFFQRPPSCWPPITVHQSAQPSRWACRSARRNLREKIRALEQRIMEMIRTAATAGLSDILRWARSPGSPTDLLGRRAAIDRISSRRTLVCPGVGMRLGNGAARRSDPVPGR